MANQTRTRAKARSSQTDSNEIQSNDDQPQDLMASVTPALQEVRRYIEGSPVRAAAIGAVAGAAIMTVFATEKGRSFAKMAYDYANPLVAKYAQEYISKAAGDIAGNALSQH